LERYGFDIKTYVDPLRALKEFREGMYDIVILDFAAFPQVGIELSKQLGQIDQNIPILFLAGGGNIDVSEISKGMLGQCWIIKKSVTVMGLVEEITSMLAINRNIPLL